VKDRRIAILGAGAVGGTIGAYLTREGHDVTLIDGWAAHVEKINSEGLTYTDLNGSFTVQAKAVHLNDVCNIREPFDMVFLSVKSYYTRWATCLIEPFLKPTGFVLPAQNGMNDELVASIVGHNRTVGCVVLYSGAMYEPAHVIRTDPLTTHAFTIGELSGMVTPRVREAVDLLSVIGPSESTANIWGLRWSKLAVNCMANALWGLLGPAVSSLNESQRIEMYSVMVTTACEVVRVACAMGVAVEPLFGVPAEKFAEAKTKKDLGDLTKAFFAATAANRLSPEQEAKIGVPVRPSLLQDVIKGRRTEVEYLNGYAVEKGKEVGVAMPVNTALTDLSKQMWEGKIKPGLENLKRLKG